MKVNVYLQSANDPRFRTMLQNFAQSIEDEGVSVRDGPPIYHEDSDVNVIFGSWKDRDAIHHVMKNKVVNSGVPFIVFETPIVGRGPVADIFQDDWYRVGINGFLADDAVWHGSWSKDDSRWNKVKKELGVSKAEWRIPHADLPVLVALQLPGDASLRGIDISEWALEVCRLIRENTDRRIVVRQPQLPRNFDPMKMMEIDKLANVNWQHGTKENLLRTLKNSHIAVTYSSGLGVDALLAGCPVYADSSASFAYPLSLENLKNIEDPHMPSRDQWIYNLCYCQWSDQEITDGTAWQHVKPLVERLRGERLSKYA